MHRTVEAIIEEDGRVRLLEPVQLDVTRRALLPSGSTTTSSTRLRATPRGSSNDRANRNLVRLRIATPH